MESFLKILFKNTVLANLLMLFFVIGGLGGLLSMNREGFPPVSFDIISVLVIYPGAGPEEVEEGITKKMEEVLQGIQGVKQVILSSKENSALAMISCLDWADPAEVKAEVTNKIDTISSFPIDAEKPLIKLEVNRNEVAQISIWGDLSERNLKGIAENLKDQILLIEHVDKVNLSGAREFEISIECSEESLRRYDLNFQDVANAIRRESLNLPGGTLRLDRESISIRTLGEAYSKKDFENIVIRAGPNGENLKVGMVAQVNDGFEELGVLGRFNGHRAATLDILKGEEGDNITLSKQLTELIEKNQKELPKGVHLTLWADMSSMVSGRIELLTDNGLVGFILVLIALWLFLDLRLSFWVGMGIPISLLGGIGIIAMMGHSINMINLFGMIMVLGIIVDDAIVVGEAIYVHREMGKSPLQAAIDGTKEVFLPVFAAVTTTILAFIPLLYVSGVMGKFIKFLPPVVIAALVISLLESLFILPVHLKSIKINKKKPSGILAIPSKIRLAVQKALDIFLKRVYEPSIRIALNYRYAVLVMAFSGLLVVVGIFKGHVLKFITFPSIDSDFIIASVEFPDGSPMSVTEDAVISLEKSWNRICKAHDEKLGQPMTLGIYASIGGIKGIIGVVPGDHLGQLFIELMPAEDRDVFYEDLISEWKDDLGEISGISLLKMEGVAHGPPGKDVEVWLLSNRDQTIKEATSLLKGELAQMDHVSEIESSNTPGKREYRIFLKEAASYYGVSLRDVAEQLQQGYFGNEAKKIQRSRDEIRVKVRYTRSERERSEPFGRTQIRIPSGELIPLSSIARYELVAGYSRIDRFNGKRKVSVTAKVDSRSGKTTADEVNESIKMGVLADLTESYPDLDIITEGMAKETKDSMQSMMIGLGLAAIGIFIIIATIFHSYLQPLVVMFVIPLGIAGAIMGHFFMGVNLSMFSLFGMVALTGIVVNDSIIMMESINSHLSRGISVYQALSLSGVRRFRPIMLTTLTTSAGLSPLLFEKSMQAQFLIPMAVSIVFGVISATMLTLIVVPSFYYILNDFRRILHWHLSGIWPNREEVEPRFKKKLQEAHE